jgi:hypothetical protein
MTAALGMLSRSLIGVIGMWELPDSQLLRIPAGSTGRCTTISKSQVLLKQEVLGPWAVLAAYKLIIGPFYEFRLSRSLSLNSLRLEQTSAGGASTP